MTDLNSPVTHIFFCDTYLYTANKNKRIDTCKDDISGGYIKEKVRYLICFYQSDRQVVQLNSIPEG